jgi:hypothetical protein
MICALSHQIVCSLLCRSHICPLTPSQPLISPLDQTSNTKRLTAAHSSPGHCSAPHYSPPHSSPAHCFGAGTDWRYSGSAAGTTAGAALTRAVSSAVGCSAEAAASSAEGSEWSAGQKTGRGVGWWVVERAERRVRRMARRRGWWGVPRWGVVVWVRLGVSTRSWRGYMG